jgi:hypothetical protein
MEDVDVDSEGVRKWLRRMLTRLELLERAETGAIQNGGGGMRPTQYVRVSDDDRRRRQEL